MMIEFRNDKGETIRVDGKLTIKQLVEYGLSIRMTPREEPKEPGCFYHDPAEPRPTSDVQQM